MFHPARFGINLLVFFLVNRNDISAMIEHDKTGAGGTLINCRDVFVTCLTSRIFYNKIGLAL